MNKCHTLVINIQQKNKMPGHHPLADPFVLTLVEFGVFVLWWQKILSESQILILKIPHYIFLLLLIGKDLANSILLAETIKPEQLMPMVKWLL